MSPHCSRTVVTSFLKYFLLIPVMFVNITPEFPPAFPRYGCLAKRLYHPIRGSLGSGAIAAICVE